MNMAMAFCVLGFRKYLWDDVWCNLMILEYCDRSHFLCTSFFFFSIMTCFADYNYYKFSSVDMHLFFRSIFWWTSWVLWVAVFMGGPGMQWAFSNKVSALPHFMSFKAAQEERPKKMIFDPITSSAFQPVSPANVFDFGHKASGVSQVCMRSTTYTCELYGCVILDIWSGVWCINVSQVINYYCAFAPFVPY